MSGIRGPRRTPAHPPPLHTPPAPWAVAALIQFSTEACALQRTAAQRGVGTPR